MDPITQQTVLAAAGAGGGGPLYVDDVFSTTLYTGNSSTQTITTGIDNTASKALVWIKSRTVVGFNIIGDTERSPQPPLSLRTDSTFNQASADVLGFTSSGVSLGNGSGSINQNGYSDVCWNFRAEPGFFDVVTYTGNGTNQTISHNLGSVPGMIMVKGVDVAEGWTVYHRSLGATKSLFMSTQSEYTSSTRWNDTEPTSSVFTVGSDNGVNQNTKTYVAYIFAHDDASFGTDGDESIIKCGTFEGNVGTVVNLGFEPQWILVKRVDGARDWFIYDTMRGLPGSDNANTLSLSPNLSATENDARSIHITSTGFKVSTTTGFNYDTHIYMAIRRPHKPPEVATEVFNPILADTPRTAVQRPEKVDMYWFGKTGGWAENIQVADRIRGFQNTNSAGDDSHTSPWMITNDVNLEAASGGAICQEKAASYGGPLVVAASSGSGFINYMFKRAPGFFDIVAYTGTGSTQSITHNLGVIPELQIVKRRDVSGNWIVFTSKIDGSNDYLYLNTEDHANDSSQSVPSATAFTWTGSSAVINASGGDYISYLFATLPGISKVGSYTGTGNNIDVDCGFTNGARFVLIKNTSNNFDWNLFDTARGITAGNDPYFALNRTTQQYSAADRIDPLSSGFTVSTTFSDYNAVGDNYIFLAIA